ncbi:hypothetical protein CRUP_020799 [Coryphaenoides rupestris]|nr:hypothetical protein CRUP_020799 [Coryphaenoides rupestris]
MHLVWIALLLFCPASVSAGNVLVAPADGSHWVNMKVIIQELHSRGPSVSVIRPADSWYIKESSPFYTQHFYTEFTGKLLELQRNGMFSWLLFQLQMQIVMHKKAANLIEHIFEDKNMIKSLRDAKFDMVLTDLVLPTGVMLSRHLDLPLVFNVRWTYDGEGHFCIAPSPPSYVPMPVLQLSDKMSFRERVLNSLLQRADLWLMRIDFVFEFPRPTMPNVIYIGGFKCRTAKPLPQYLEDFVQSSGEHGVIVMSLGTLFARLPNEVSEEIAAAFAKLPQKVIWRYIGEPPASLGNNTLLVDWMPQNDLLGHEKTKVFVAHGGTNGLQEAIYHGVPILGLPLIFDQHDNLFKIELRGASKILNILTIDRDSFYKVLKKSSMNPHTG